MKNTWKAGLFDAALSLGSAQAFDLDSALGAATKGMKAATLSDAEVAVLADSILRLESAVNMRKRAR